MSRYLDKILAVRTRESEFNLDKRKWVRRAYMLKQMQGSIKSVNVVLKVDTTETQPERLQCLSFNRIGKKLPQILTRIKYGHQDMF